LPSAFNKENLKAQQQPDNENNMYVQKIVNGLCSFKSMIYGYKATIKTNNQNIITAENALISKLSYQALKVNFKEFENLDVVDDTDVKDENNIMMPNSQPFITKA
jgi:outer membrane protein